MTLNEDLTLINSLTKACRLVNDQIKTRLPINKDMLSVLVRQIENDYLNRNQPYLSTLYKALLITTYFGLFRVGELTDAPGKHAVRAKDIHIAHNKKKFSFVLRTSKTHWKNSKPQIIKISTSDGKKELTNRINENTLPCPYPTIKHYLQLRGNTYRYEDEQFFIFSDHSAVTATNFRNCLHKTITNAGFQHPHLYLVHGIRAGRACDLLKLGLSVSVIKKMGRWKSNTVYKYLR